MARDGEFWTARVANADKHKKVWRKIVTASRQQLQGAVKDFELDDLQGGMLFNKMYAAEQTIFAQLRPKRVNVRLAPDRQDRADHARRAQAFVNWNIREADILEIMGETVQHSRIDGVGIMKVEWGGHMAPRISSGANEGQDAALAAVGAQTDSTGRRGRSIAEAMRQTFPNDKMFRQMALSWNIDPLDFFKDETHAVLRDSTWAGHRVWFTKRQLMEWQKSGFFLKTKINFDRGALDSTRERWNDNRFVERQLSNAQGVGLRLPGDDDLEELVEVHEIHDMEMDKVVWIVPGTNTVLRTEDTRPHAEGLPYIDLRFGKVAWEFWSIPDNFHYIEMQNTLNEITSSLAEHAARFGKVIVPVPKNMPADQKRSIARATGGSLVEVDDPRVIQPMDFGPLPIALMQMIPLIENGIIEIGGLSQPATGRPGAASTTATEVRSISEQFSTRMDRMRDDVELMMEKVARRILQLGAQFFTEADAIPLLGIEAVEWGAEVTGNITKDDIQGEYGVKVSVGAGAERLDIVEKKQVLDLYNLFINNPAVNPIALTELVIRKFGMDPDLLLQGQETPAVNQLRQAMGAEDQDMQTRAGNPNPANDLGAAIRQRAG